MNDVDDPDKIPVAPSLADNEVPNCPGAILMHKENKKMIHEEGLNQVKSNTANDL